MTTIYNVWRVNIANNHEDYFNSHFDETVALNEAKALIEDRGKKMAGSKVIKRGSSYTLQTSTGRVAAMYSVRSQEVKGAITEDISQPMLTSSTNDIYEWERAARMYEDYLHLRKITINKIKDDSAFAEHVSLAPGPAPGRKQKAAKEYVAKPQELTPSRINCIYEYLHQKGVDF